MDLPTQFFETPIIYTHPVYRILIYISARNVTILNPFRRCVKWIGSFKHHPLDIGGSKYFPRVFGRSTEFETASGIFRGVHQTRDLL